MPLAVLNRADEDGEAECLVVERPAGLAVDRKPCTGCGMYNMLHPVYNEFIMHSL